MSIVLLGLYIAIIFVRPMEWWEPVMDWQLVTGMAYATILTAFPRIMSEHKRLWRTCSELRWAVGLLLAATASWAIYPFWPSGMSTTFQTFGKIIVLYCLVLLLGREPRSFRLLLWTILLCVTWMAINGMLEHSRGFGFGGKEPRYRPDSGVYQINAFGIFDDPNDLCLVFILVIPIAYAIFKAEQNVLTRVAALASIPFSMYGAWLTNSRGGIMGIFGMLVAYTIARSKGARRYVIAGSAIVLVSVVAPSRFAKGLGGGGRLIPWGDGIAAWTTHPLFGVGYNAFGDYSSEGKPAHNSYIHILTELGVLGYIPFFMLLYLTMLHLRKAIRYTATTNRTEHLYMSGIFSGMAGYLTAIYFLSRQYNHVLYVMLALSTCAVLRVCRDPAAYQAILGSYQKDRKLALKVAFASIPFLYFTVKIGYLLGVG